MTEEAQKPTQKPKIGDRPHLVTLIFSTAAVVISLFSYMETHKARVVNEEVNRPLVRVVSIDLIGPVMDKDLFKGPKFQNAYVITLRSSGKAFANNVQVDFKAQLDDSRTGEGFARFSDFQDATIESSSLGDLAPDDQYRLSFWALVLKNPPITNFGGNVITLVSLYVKGKLVYTNPINGDKYEQSFCFNDPGTNGHFWRCPDNNK